MPFQAIADILPPVRVVSGVKAAIEGRLPHGFGVTRLTDPPMVWSDQSVALGLAPPAN
jgi:hypothetical protein